MELNLNRWTGILIKHALLFWTGGWVALEEWKLRLTSAKVEVEVQVEAELGNN